MNIPEPVIAVTVKPISITDEKRLRTVLERLALEDPTLRVKDDGKVGQMLISGMSELHLEIAMDRIKREFSIQADFGRPQVAYLETIKQLVQAEGKCISQATGHGGSGHVWLLLEPLERGKNFEFVDKSRNGAIPKKYILAVRKGVEEAMTEGVLAGYPVVNVKATVFDGSCSKLESSEMAFKMAALAAFKEGMRKAKPVLLEPIMKFEVIASEEFIDSLIADLNARRAQISENDHRGNARAIRGTVPLGEMFGYAPTLRSLSQGQASFTMEPSHYAEKP